MLFFFSSPVYLPLLFLIPLVIAAHFIILKRKRAHALKFANFEAIARVKGIDLLSKNIFILLLTCLIILLVVFSLSGLNVQRTVSTSAFSFALAIDSSSSMEANDFSPNRIEAAKSTALSFVDSAPSGSRFAVVSFSGNSFIEQEITNNRLLIKDSIKRISLSPVAGTDLEEAVITSSNLLQGENSKAVILISDGQINVGTIEELIKYANKHNVLVHAIAIGTEQGGQTSFGLSKVDKDSLQAIAFNTNGKFFQATDQLSLDQSFREISDLEITNVSFNLSSYLSIVALFLFILEYVLVNTRYRVLP